VENRAAVRCSGVWSGVSDGAPLYARLTGRWSQRLMRAQFAGLSAAGQRAVLVGVVPGPRGTVAGQSGVVSSFLMYPDVTSSASVEGILPDPAWSASFYPWSLLASLPCHWLAGRIGRRGLLL
jgi:hypothetical protein